MFSDGAVEGRNKRQRSLSERVSEREREGEREGLRTVERGRGDVDGRERVRERDASVGWN